MVELTPAWAFSEADERAMELALEEAARAGAAGEVPVGAVLLDSAGEPIACAQNRRERSADPTGHAEIFALREGGRKLGAWRLDGCSLYVTLEPCAMCAAACVTARLATVVWGAPDPKAGFAGSLANLFEDPRLMHRVAWRGGLHAEASAALLSSFFANLRGQR